MDLFEQSYQQKVKSEAPLADRMRPRTLDEFVGQDHIVGTGRLLRRAIVADRLSSLIFFGPPGTGKTTLARIIAQTTRAHFIAINAVLAGVKDLREAIAKFPLVRHCENASVIIFMGKSGLQKLKNFFGRTICGSVPFILSVLISIAS